MVCGSSLEITSTSQVKGKHQAEARENSDGSNEHSLKAGVKVKKLENTWPARYWVQDLIVRQLLRKAGSLGYPNEETIFIC